MERIGFGDRYTSPNCHQYDFHFLCGHLSFHRTVLTRNGGRWIIDTARQTVLEIFPVGDWFMASSLDGSELYVSKDNMIAAISAPANMCRLC